MKICQKCRHQNEDSMSFCLECGAPLSSPIIVNLNDPKTQSQQGAPPTNFGANREPETVVANNQMRVGANFQQSSTSNSKSNAKIFLVVGGIGALLLLFAVAGAAIVGYNIIGKPKPTPYPTSSPIYSPSGTTTPVYAPTPVYSPTPTPTANTANRVGSATYSSMRVEFNVTQDGKTGMRIHVNFSTHKLKDTECYVLVSFLKSDNTMIMASNDTYKGPKGQLAVYIPITPAFDEAIYKDVVLFMPDDQFKLDKGTYNLKMDVDVIYKNGDDLQHLNLYPFKYE